MRRRVAAAASAPVLVASNGNVPNRGEHMESNERIHRILAGEVDAKGGVGDGRYQRRL
jgi:hypothetical protein